MKLSEIPTHHAVLIVHEKRDDIADVLFQELQMVSPAHRFFNQTVLDIETARTIITWAYTPYNDEKIGLISFHTASVPAQNAMLKILEEPPVGVRFIVLTSNKENLIGTILSRVHEMKIQNEERSMKHEDKVKEFLQTPHSLRMKLLFIIELLARIDEEGRKDREAVRQFILSIALLLSEKKIESRYVLDTLYMASYASDASASGKALLEYLALSLPVVK